MGYKSVYLFSFLLMGLAYSREEISLDSFNWILGNWQYDMGKSIACEQWKQVSPNTFEGEGFTIKNSAKDTLLVESLRLMKMHDQIFYQAYVKHNPGPVSFKLTKMTADSSVFENPLHDFPQKILYIKNSPASVTVIVEGSQKGESKGFKMEFKKEN